MKLALVLLALLTLLAGTPWAAADPVHQTTTPATQPASQPATQPSPLSVEEAKEFLDRFEELGRQFDPAIAGLYADDALIQSVRRYPNGRERTMKFEALMYKRLIRTLMPFAKARNDVSTLTDVTYSKEGDRIRINATRHSELKNYDSPYSLLVGRSSSGQLLIYEEFSVTQPLPSAE